MRTPRIKTAALLATVGMSAVALGSASAADDQMAAATTTTPVVPTAPTTVAPATTAAAATTVAAPVTTAAGATTGAAPTTIAGAAPTTIAGATSAGLPAGSTFAQIQEFIKPMFGPTTDAVAEFAIFGITPPSGIPTPEGADVYEFSISMSPNVEDPDFSYYRAKVIATFTAPATDVVTLYQTQMIAAGYVQTGDSVENEGDRQVRFLQYDLPAPTYDSAEVIIGIVDDDTDFVQIEFTEAFDPTLVSGFNAWPAGLPLLDISTGIGRASINTFNYGGDITVYLDTQYLFDLPEADTSAQFLAAVPASPYTIDAERSDEEITYLTGGELEELTIFFNEGYPEGTSSMTVSGDADLVL